MKVFRSSQIARDLARENEVYVLRSAPGLYLVEWFDGCEAHYGDGPFACKDTALDAAKRLVKQFAQPRGCTALDYVV
jgi:hypothetical protein